MMSWAAAQVEARAEETEVAAAVCVRDLHRCESHVRLQGWLGLCKY